MPVFKKSPPSGSVRVRTMRRRLLKVSQQDGLVPFSNFRFSNRGSVLGGEGNCPRGMSGGNVWRGNVLHSVDRRRTIVTPAPVNLFTNDTEWPKKRCHFLVCSLL